MAVSDRGFASMNRFRQKEIASMGGKAAHEKGVAHQWTKEEAIAAGRKGGFKSGEAKRKKQLEKIKQVVGVETSSHFDDKVKREIQGILNGGEND